MAWTITWKGHTWTDEDLTGQHLATLALLAGDDRFELLDITEDEVRAYPGEGFMRLMFMLSAFVGVEVSQGIEDETEAADALARALNKVQQASAEEILASISFG